MKDIKLTKTDGNIRFEFPSCVRLVFELLLLLLLLLLPEPSVLLPGKDDGRQKSTMKKCVMQER